MPRMSLYVVGRQMIEGAYSQKSSNHSMFYIKELRIHQSHSHSMYGDPMRLLYDGFDMIDDHIQAGLA